MPAQWAQPLPHPLEQQAQLLAARHDLLRPRLREYAFEILIRQGFFYPGIPFAAAQERHGAALAHQPDEVFERETPLGLPTAQHAVVLLEKREENLLRQVFHLPADVAVSAE